MYACICMYMYIIWLYIIWLYLIYYIIYYILYTYIIWLYIYICVNGTKPPNLMRFAPTEAQRFSFELATMNMRLWDLAPGATAHNTKHQRAPCPLTLPKQTNKHGWVSQPDLEVTPTSLGTVLHLTRASLLPYNANKYFQFVLVFIDAPSSSYKMHV